LRIKSLEIAGFKSFVDKVVLAFQPGISGIVGPNGCGKSNVVDAMRWAMGEQSPRRLRGKGMEDVIFAGSEARAPVGLAEVTLSFDNADGTAPPAYAAYAEIQISRRLYRSGESEYRINKVPCRLRDVQDFFRDTGIGTKGYTIVEQGQIAGIVSAKPEERRSLIEEAAGIGKYKVRRQEAERKIEATEHNLVRVSDVVGEIRRQIGSLERQARKAARYKRLREMQRWLELSLAADERLELEEGLLTARAGLGLLRDEATALETHLAERELALEQARLELAERERMLNQDSEVLVGLRGEIKELESRIGYETRERTALAEMNEARREELKGLATQRGAACAERDSAEAALAAVEASLGAESQAIAAAEAQARDAAEALQGLERERDAASAALVDVLTRVARLEDRQASLEDRRAELDRRLRSADEVLEVQGTEAAGVASEERALADGLRNLLGERDRLMGEHRAAIEGVERTQVGSRSAAARATAARESRDLRRARLESLREVVERREDLGAAARHLLEQGDALRDRLGLRALVRDVLETDREIEAAVEAVLAERAEALVVGRREDALAAIEALREAGAGRGVFVAEPRLEEMPIGFVPLGQPLLDRVRARPGFEGVARTLLAGVNLVDDLAEALRVYGTGRMPATFVTPAGDLLSPDGIVRGGGAAAGQGLLTRARELRELEVEVAALESELALRESERGAAEVAAVAASDELDNLRNRHHTVALAVANHEKDLERARDRVKSLGEAREGRFAERSELLAEAELAGADRERLLQTLAALRQDRSDRQRVLDAVGLRVGAAAREASRQEAALSGRRVEHAGRVEKREALHAERARAAGALRTAEAWIARRESEIAAAEARREVLAGTLAEAEFLLARRLEDEEAARATHEEKRDAYERDAARVRDVEAEARTLRSESSDKRDAAQRAELALRDSEFRLESLERQVQERWGVALATWTAPAPGALEALGADADEAAEEGEVDAESAAADDDAPALTARAAEDLLALPREERQRRVSDVKRKLEALGEVNLGAIEEHEELAERFRFLSEQKADLESTLGSLREAILRINRTSRKRFEETFEAVNARFVENFPRLFRGGKAHLALTEEEDVLDAGIEIVASPPGKRLQSVNLLSGGEKTLTALALLVSVFQVRPSPFFLLDEVDAALDDANVGRFNEIVRELARDSQFLLITHNKRTIEVSDVLYGVTMEERGVSKLVAVALRDGSGAPLPD
jgi:chromosome segregation protein